MNLGNSHMVNKQSMMPSSSGASWKSAGAGEGSVPDQFPAGLRVLVVDDDPTCLMILEKMLRTCNYEVTKCNRAEVALSLLRENKNGYDVVISDVHMPDMDGFKLLERIGLEMDLPVIMMSADDSKNVVMKGVTHGACDYLIKPVRMEALRNIWQHVVRKRKHEWKDFETSASVDDGERQQKPPEDPEYSSSANEGSTWKNTKRRKDDEDEAEERDDSSSMKKPRVVWSVELHQQFVAAVNQLGIDKAVPKKILELMNVPGLTRENVASHLQKYRLYLRRLSGSQHPGGLNTSFMGNDGPYGSITSLNGLDLQALAASGQLPPQSLATLQAAALGRSNNSKSAISVPLIDQRNIFSFENPKLRYGEIQSQHLNNSNNSKQMNLLHGIPTNMEPKQLVGLHQSVPHSFGGMNSQVLIPMGSGPTQSNSNHQHIPRQPVLPNGMLTRGGVVDNMRDTSAVYNPAASQASALVDFSMNQKTDLPGNSFPVGGVSGISTHASTSVLHGDANLEPKASRGGIVPSYDIFNDLNQNRSQDWSLQNVGLTFDASQQTNNVQGLDMSSTVLLQHNYSSGQKIGGPNHSSTGGKVMFSAGGGGGTHRSSSNIGEHNTYVGDNPLRVKAESINDGSSNNTLYPEQYSQDDLLTAILKQQQQQEGIGQPENEFGFDGYALDNLPV